MTADEPTRLQQLEQENATLRAERDELRDRLAHIDDLTCDIKPDEDSEAGGTIEERVEALVQIEATLRELAEGLKADKELLDLIQSKRLTIEPLYGPEPPWGSGLASDFEGFLINGDTTPYPTIREAVRAACPGEGKTTASPESA